MTREEIVVLLEILAAMYPNTMSKIGDPERMIQGWELAFGDEPAEVIYKAARHHMKTCKFFPTVADIFNSKQVGEMIYGQLPTQGGSKEIPSGYSVKLIGPSPDSVLCFICEQYDDCNLHNFSKCPQHN